MVMHHTKPNFKKELIHAWEIATLKKETMHHVAEGGKAETVFGYYVIAAAAIFGMIGQHFFISWFKPTLTASLLSGLFHIIYAVIGIYVISLIAQKLFKGKGKHEAFFRVMAYALIVTWINLIPSLAIIGGIWMLVIAFNIIKSVHHLKTGSAIGTLIVGTIAMMLIAAVLSPTGTVKKYGGGNFRSGSFNLNIDGPDGSGSIKFDDGKIMIEGADGEKIEITIPGS